MPRALTSGTSVFERSANPNNTRSSSPWSYNSQVRCLRHTTLESHQGRLRQTLSYPTCHKRLAHRPRPPTRLRQVVRVLDMRLSAVHATNVSQRATSSNQLGPRVCIVCDWCALSSNSARPRHGSQPVASNATQTQAAHDQGARQVQMCLVERQDQSKPAQLQRHQLVLHDRNSIRHKTARHNRRRRQLEKASAQIDSPKRLARRQQTQAPDPNPIPYQAAAGSRHILYEKRCTEGWPLLLQSPQVQIAGVQTATATALRIDGQRPTHRPRRTGTRAIALRYLRSEHS